MDSKKEHCVRLNIHVDCKDCDRCDKCDDYRKEHEGTCVEINVFFECDNKKKSYSYEA